METVTAEEWLYKVLKEDTELTALVGDRIYSYVAPAEADFPLVIFQMQDGADVRGVGPSRIMTDLTMVVKVVNQGLSSAALETIADRIDTILQGASGDGVLGCVRLQPLSFVEIVDGIQYRHLGGIYQVYAQ